MSGSLDDENFNEVDFEDDEYSDMVKQPRFVSKMRRIEVLQEQKKLLHDLDDFADDEPMNLTEYDEGANE